MRDRGPQELTRQMGRMGDADPAWFPGRSAQLREYERLLASWPGLVSRSVGEVGGVRALVEDSLVLLDHLGDASALVDVGSGGGMPGIPVAVARPDLEVTLLEADGRRAAFLVHAAASLGLRVRVVAERAEDAGRGPLREAFDVAASRALGPMPVVAELCLPLVRVGGRLLAMRTAAEGAGAPWGLLGGGAPSIIPGPSAARREGVLVEVRKVAPTPAAYPRRPGVPARRPLPSPRA
jgi:16S rRNA (guanine527-N7)-methyltransferase